MFVVMFNEGYYAEKQPDYEWSFTNKLSSAHVYKTKKGALKKIEYAKYIQDTPYGTGKLIEVNVVTTVEVV